MKPFDEEFRIEYLATGAELLDGTSGDRHAQSIGARIAPLGLKLSRASTVNDDPKEITQALTEALIRSRVLIVTGGLGPTTDDRTLEAAAEALGTELVESTLAKQNVERVMKRFKKQVMNSGQKKQFKILKGGRVLSNEKGTAPALHYPQGDRDIFFLPGVPREFDHCFEKHLMPWLRSHQKRQRPFLRVLKIFGGAESELNELLLSLKLPKSIEVGFRTTLPENHIKLSLVASSEREADQILKPSIQKLKKALGNKIFTTDLHQSFEEAIVQDLTRHKKKIALAESCTGGLAAQMITSVSGSSKVLDRGFVTYSNEAKEELLGVSANTLQKYGAVSEECVREMVEGALERSSADMAASITGVAGPTGGSKDKPVGTVWLGFREKGGSETQTKKLELPFDRRLNREFSAYAALNMIRAVLK